MSADDGLDEIQAIFFEECVEGLAVAEAGLSAMADGDVSTEVIASVFRAVHSIKGGSGAFGHGALLAFSHRFENVLDEVRAGRIAPTEPVTRVMLGAFDILSDHVAAAQGLAPAPSDAAMLEQLDEILAKGGVDDEAAMSPTAASSHSAAAAPAAAAETLAPDDDFGFMPVVAMVEEFDPFGFEPVAVALDYLDGDPAPVVEAEEARWTVRFRPSRAALANGAEPLLTLRELEAMGGTVLAVDMDGLPALQDLDPEDGYTLWTVSLPGHVAEGDIAECFDFVPPDSLVEIGRDVPEAVEVIPAEAPAPVEAEAPPVEVEGPAPQQAQTAVVMPFPSPAAAPAEPPRAAEAAVQTIRVDLGKLDQLLNLVGELVIHGSILSDRLSPADQERVELPDLARLTREIQDNVMSLRAQPIRQAFSRVPRMLRDLMAETGKKVLLETSGEMTEVDKGVIEKIGDPLTHMIRNAVDHGIESPEERIAAGKPPEGTIRMSAEQKGARIIVRVADDGRGINRERVRAKAIEKGIISAEAHLSDEEIDGLICAPGFSTAETISNISGRGVGMDVVRANVEALGGRVEIHSVPGQGTSFSMSLPLTLAILDGMIVRVGRQRFVLPLTNLVETLQPEPEQVKRTSPRNEVIELRGNYLPVKRLSHLFGMNAQAQQDDEEAVVIVVDTEMAGQVGLMVDMIENQREVVIKSLEDNLYPVRGLAGATILGDGSIGLILDMEALVAASSGQGKYSIKGMAA
ncbi:MAG TPA: chemotaxis protein CheA [Sphingobium sp.]|uniref:chemotaxis protein CheA n=1 Tax=Sphingobium sp. TaxID=1912891 RepID=UPI002ECFB699